MYHIEAKHWAKSPQDYIIQVRPKDSILICEKCAKMCLCLLL